jgi:hypothetical protein
LAIENLQVTTLPNSGISKFHSLQHFLFSTDCFGTAYFSQCLAVQILEDERLELVEKILEQKDKRDATGGGKEQ